MAAESQQPFFLMASSHDPHRPYSGGASRERHFERAASSRTYRPDEVKVPGFLPDLPDIRKEMAGYCTSTRRLDDVVGVVLDALAEDGRVDDTIMVFLSDHGISAPLAKSSCCVESISTSLIVRWPGKVAAKQVDRRHMISTVDLLPTLLEAVGLPSPDRQDGRSFLPLLRDGTQSGRDAVFAQFYHIHGRKPYPMSSVITRDHVYVFNAWVNGKRTYSAEPIAGLTYRAMKRAGEKDVRLTKRVHLLLYRTVEGFYDLNSDPFCLKNLTNDRPAAMSVLQKQLRDWMVKYGNFALKAFDQRDSPAALEQFMKDYTERSGKEVEALKPYEEAKRYRF